MTVLFQNRYALNAYAFCHCFASSAHAEKMQALFRLCLLSATDRGFRRTAPRIACNAQNPTDGDNKPRFTLSLLCLTNSGIRSAMQALLSRRGGQRFTEALLFPPVRIPLYVAKRKQRHPVQGAFVFVGGDGGIRTHGRVTPSTDFESVPL